MVIDGISPIQGPNSTGRSKAVRSPEKSEARDGVQLSNESIAKLDREKLTKIVRDAPEVRAEKVAAARERLANVETDEMLQRVADRIIDDLGIPTKPA